MTQRDHTRQLARAFKRLEKAEDICREAQLEFDAQFGQWAAGRRVNRDEARRQLVSTGYLEPRMVRR